MPVLGSITTLSPKFSDPIVSSQHAPSYYAASANPAPQRPALDGDVQADVCVVGGGFSGLSAALHCLQRGRSVLLLEGKQIGWGASGRNGGQIVNGLNASLPHVQARFGADTAQFIGSLLQEGASIIRGFVADHQIDCDLKQRNVYVAFNEKHMQGLRDKQTLWQAHGMDDHELLDKEQLQQYVTSELYYGGMVDHSGGHLHPLNLALGEADAIEKLGGRVCENTPVLSVNTDANQPTVTTASGRVTCNTLVLCGNAYLGKTVPALAARVMPVSTQVMATEVLGDELAHQLLPNDACIEDVRYILDYYRLSADKRLLFGGGTIYGGRDPRSVEAKLRPNMEKVFPALKGIGVEYAWSGNFALSFSRVPQLGRLGSHTVFAMGYSGHGVTGSHLFGRLLAEGIAGESHRFDRFAKLPWMPFPGGQRFGPAYSTLGSWWYGFRDAVGV